MPRNYAAAAPGARPATRRGAYLPGPGDEIGDALLRARQATLNTSPCTPEHFAAYAAWAGVTDRRTALDLHRAGVDADQVNDYTRAGVDATDYPQMIRLATAGVTAATLATWRQMATRRQVRLSTDDVIAYRASGVDPTQVEPYLSPVGVTMDGDDLHLPFRANPAAVTSLIAAQVSPLRAQYYHRTGVRTPAHMGTLAHLGCRPKVVTAYRNTLGIAVRRFAAADFLRYYADVHRATAGNRDLDHVLVSRARSVDEAAAWTQAAVAARRVDLYLRCGISPTEHATDPAVATADEATLATLAALRDDTALTLVPA